MRKFAQSGTDVMILKKYFRRKIQRKKLAFLTQNNAKLCKILIITLVFEKNANFFAKICRKLQKIVIITSPNLVTLLGTYVLFRSSVRFICTMYYVPNAEE
jgi:hypothetical protein